MISNVAINQAGTARLWAFAVMICCALPIQIMGRAAIAGALLMALLCFISLPGKSVYLKRALGAMRSPFGALLLATFIFWLPNAYFSIDPQRSLDTAVRTFVYIGFATLFWAVIAENRTIHDLSLRALVLASSVAIIIALIAQSGVPELYWFLHFMGWLSMPLGTSLKAFSALAVLLIPIFIWAGVRLSGIWTVLSFANVVGFAALVWLTYNRAAIAGLLAMIVIAAGLAAWSSRSRAIKVFLPLGALVALIGVFVWLNITRQQVDFGNEWLLPLWLIDFQRQTIWNFAIQLIQQNFWFGMGINTINFAPGADAVIPNTVSNLKMIPSHPHNWILEVAAETGIFGLLSLCGAIVLTFYKSVRCYLRDGDYAFMVAVCIAAGYWVSGLFNFSFWSSWWQMSFVLMTALCLALKVDPSVSKDRGPVS